MNTRFLILGAFLALQLPLRAADPFEENIRPTDALTPEQEQKAFSLPPGFAIQLVACEPDIQKPMNMAFDAKGRLWVTTSTEYPFPVPPGKPAHDCIKILEDFDAMGRAHKVTTFADNLDVPIGIYPYKNGAIVWSIPNIWYLQDTDGDGKADKMDVLYGPFGWQRDTHGMQNSFRRGFDGWLYATHGYNNISNVRAGDGSEVHMQSGNTYRMRLNTSHIEQWTHGQVNPFGLFFDASGRLFSADCHSLPVYDLLRNAYYPSFGKPDDGLGFGPTIIDHLHGSTAIAGIVVYSEGNWPAEFQNNSFVGNVMTSRIDRDTLVQHGASETAREEPDFVSTKDPWFRPVDLQLGADGAMYVADFYNKIIGHYEVPLNHPGRDRYRGRIWRISYTNGFPIGPLKLPSDTPEQLISQFALENISRRMIAMNELVDHFGASAIGPLKTKLNSNDPKPTEIVHCLWAIERLGALDPSMLEKFSKNSDRNVRIHIMRILSETPNWTDAERKLVLDGMNDAEPLVERAAADAMGQHPSVENVEPLLSLLDRAPRADDHLVHMTRLALRNQVIPEENLRQVATRKLSAKDSQEIADVCVAITNGESATFLVQYIQEHHDNPQKVTEYVRHAARYAPPDQLPRLTAFVRNGFRDAVDQQLSFFKAVQDGSAQRGIQLPAEVREWGGELAGKLFDAVDSSNLPWYNMPAPGRPVSINPWFLQRRNSADGDKGSMFLCSLMPGGEQLTGILRSKPFTIPEHLSFFLAGHDGFPDKPPGKNNLVRLVSADSGEMLIMSAPPRNDLAQKIDWDLRKYSGRQGRIELVDADTGSAYAWLAAGRFEPPVVPMPSVSPNQIGQRIQAAADLAQTLGVRSLEPKMSALLVSDSLDLDGRAAISHALVTLSPNEDRAALAPLVGDATVNQDLRKKIGEALADGDKGDSLPVLIEAMRTSPSKVQSKLAQSLAGSAAGGETLVAMAEKGQASPRVLLDKVVQDKLAAIKNDELRGRIKKLTSDLAPASEVVQKLIDERRASYNPSKARPEEGARVFAQNCAICHQIAGVGAVVGPQLDGIGNRGLDRVIEDVLDPNRNVDVNFRTHIILLKDSDVVSGLPRREEGEVLVLADSTGKEMRIPKKDIQSRRESDTSLMPANFGDVIPPDDFQNLISFLLSKSGTK